MHRRLRSRKRKRFCVILAEQHGNCCFYCARTFEGAEVRLRTLDHLIPLSRGGTNELSNLALCCSKCNNAKGDRTWREYLRSDDHRKRVAGAIRRTKVEVVATLAVA